MTAAEGVPLVLILAVSYGELRSNQVAMRFTAPGRPAKRDGVNHFSFDVELSGSRIVDARMQKLKDKRIPITLPKGTTVPLHRTVVIEAPDEKGKGARIVAIL